MPIKGITRIYEILVIENVDVLCFCDYEHHDATLYVQQMNIIKITITITLKLMYMTYKLWERM